MPGKPPEYTRKDAYTECEEEKNEPPDMVDMCKSKEL
jgi:hypothetical protein